MPSPFQQHLGTNYVPSIEEVKAIRTSIIATSVQDLRAIDEEIQQIHQKLRLLEEKRERIHRIVRQHEALISPARRIDRDILQEIFLACIPEDRNPCMSSAEAPILLTHICSSWRSIAYSLPSLWSAIHIVLPNLHTEIFMTESMCTFSEDVLRQKLHRRQEIATEWLKRSCASPLSISVYQAPCINGHPVDPFDIPSIMERERKLHISFLLNTLMPHSHRWYEFDICLSPQTLHMLFAHGIHVPMLKKIHITSRETRDTSHQNRNSVCLEWKHVAGLLSSQPTSISLIGIYIQPSDLPLIQNSSSIWRHVRELSLDTRPTFIPSVNMEPSLADMTNSIIRHCHSMRTLKMIISNINHHNNGTNASWARIVGNILLPRLENLSLRIDQLDFEVTGFIQHLQLPSLRVLNIQLPVNPHENTSPSSEAVLEQLMRSFGESLLSLNIYSPQSLVQSRKSIAKFLLWTSSLKSLRLLTSNIRFSHHDRWVKSPGSTSNIYSPLMPIVESEIDEDTGIPLKYQDVADFFSDSDIFNDLWPLGKEQGDIICPQLEVLECDPEVLTGISAHGLRSYLKARQEAHLINNEITALRQVRIFINEYRQQDVSLEEKVSLDKNSAIYYRKLEDRFSPYEGFVSRNGKPDIEIPREVYKDL